MKFTVSALWNGRRESIDWVDGYLVGGPDELAHRIQQEAAALEGLRVAFPTMAGTTTDHLDDPFSALRIFMRVLGDDLVATGNVPVAPEPGGSRVVY